MKRRDYSHEMRPLRSAAARLMMMGMGTLFVVLGTVGAFLPVLPTTPFMLLAAACYARSSPRFYNWLLNNRLFGSAIHDWRQHRKISRKAKWTASSLIVMTLGISIIFVVDNPYLRLLMILIGLGVVTFLLRIPSREYQSP